MKGWYCSASEMEEGGMKCTDIEVCPAISKVMCPAPSKEGAMCSAEEVHAGIRNELCPAPSREGVVCSAPEMEGEVVCYEI